MTRIRTIQSTFLGLCDNGLNLTSYVAKEGHNEEVEQLLKLGGKIEDAIYGYALAGNLSQVALLCKQCSESQKPFAVGHAIRGYARAGNFESIYAIENFLDYKADMLLGAAQAGDENKVKSMLNRDIKLFVQAVEGYADCNHQTLLTELIQGKPFYPLAIYFAARSGHVELVNDLLQQCRVSVDYKVYAFERHSDGSADDAFNINACALMNHALQGYIAGCHFNEAAAMIERGATISQALSKLQNVDGLTNPSPYLVLLAYIKDKKISSAVLEQMKLRGKVSSVFKITKAHLEQVDQIKVCMSSSHLNYVEAKNKVEDDSCHTFSEDDLTLDFLEKILGQELGLVPAVKSLKLS